MSNDIRKSDYASEYEFKGRDGPKTFVADIKTAGKHPKQSDEMIPASAIKGSKRVFHERGADGDHTETYDEDKPAGEYYRQLPDRKDLKYQEKPGENRNRKIKETFMKTHNNKKSASSLGKISVHGKNVRGLGTKTIKKNTKRFKKTEGTKKIGKMLRKPLSSAISSLKDYQAGNPDNSPGNSSFDMARDTFNSNKRKTDELMELLKKVVMIVKAVVTSALLPLLALLALVFVVVSTVMSIVGADRQESSYVAAESETKNYPGSVYVWRASVEDRLAYYFDEEKDYDSRDFTDAVLVLIWMESSGLSDVSEGDIMQCRESGNMTNNLPEDWDELTTELRSIDGGVRMFLALIESWGVTSSDDYIGLQIVSQAYNYGPGFLDYLKGNSKSEWTEELSKSFSDKQKQENGYLIYGNPSYGKVWLERYRAVYSSGNMTWPVPETGRGNSITDYFGPREAPTAGASTNHMGIDIGVREGADIVAALDGKVTASEYSSIRGNYVVIEHSDGKETWYMHMSERTAVLGQTVKAGGVIGKVGMTGVATGPHLHFEVHVNGEPVDPMEYFK